MHPGQVDSGDVSPSGLRGVRGDPMRRINSATSAGLRVELSEPCNTTHKPRVFEGRRLVRAASFAVKAG